MVTTVSDVDAILADGEYRDRKGRTWQPLGVGGVWWHFPSDRTLTPDQMRTLIERDLHRDACPGLPSCFDHPVPFVWWGSLTGNWYAVPAGASLGLSHPTLGAALDAARHMTGETP